MANLLDSASLASVLMIDVCGASTLLHFLGHADST